MLAALPIPLGAVRLLLGFTLTSSKSMFSICATTWATYEHYRLSQCHTLEMTTLTKSNRM